jgi:hypothetical protein
MTKGEVRNPPRNEVQLRLLQVGAATIDDSKLLIFGAEGEDAGRLNVAGVADVAIDRAIGFIDGSGVVPQLEAWSDEYRTMLRGSHGRAGR